MVVASSGSGNCSSNSVVVVAVDAEVATVVLVTIKNLIYYCQLFIQYYYVYTKLQKMF